MDRRRRTASGSHGSACRSSRLGPLDRVDAAELLDEPLPAGLAEPGDAVEGARRHPLAAPLAVERVGEAVGLVADALQHEQRLAPPRDLDRLATGRARTPPRSAWPGRRRGSRPPGRARARPARRRRAGPCRRRRRAAAAGRRTCPARSPRSSGGRVPLGEVRRQPAGQDLLHRRVVVVAGHVDLEPAVLPLVRQPVLEHDHRADVVGALQVGHVVALDAQRRLGQLEVAAAAR